jgi:hypothetical protein
MTDWQIPPESLGYIVRTCIRDAAGVLRSPASEANGFVWPSEIGAIVTAPDWNPAAVCGGGLHGLRPGQQEPGVWATGSDAVWIVCAYDTTEAVDLGGKMKVPRCRVELVVAATDGAATAVPEWLRQRGITDAGYASTLTGGDDSTLTGGNRSTLTGGDDSTLTGGNRSTLTGGNRSTLTGGNRSTLTGGYASTLTGGDDSTLICRWWDGQASRYRTIVAEVGEHAAGLAPEETIQAGQPYRIEIVDGRPAWRLVVKP